MKIDESNKMLIEQKIMNSKWKMHAEKNEKEEREKCGMKHEFL